MSSYLAQNVFGLDHCYGDHADHMGTRSNDMDIRLRVNMRRLNLKELNTSSEHVFE